MFVALAACSFAIVTAASPPPPFLADDRADLEAFIARREDAAAARITARLDGLVDEIAKASGSHDDAGGSRKAKRGSSRAPAKPKAADDAAERSLMPKLASAAAAWRLTQLTKSLSPEQGTAMWGIVDRDPLFAQTLAFTIMPEADRLPAVASVAERLASADPEGVARHPELAAAICVVHDAEQVTLRVNENTGRAPPPDLVWRWFTSNASSMRYGIDMAPELFVIVVDAPASPEELAWALKNFAGIPRVGALYQKVEYDFDSLQGKPKKCDVAGWNLPNILRCGGICADQAYFTTTVAKALGIPAAYTSGYDATSGHAWAGFVHGSGKKIAWDVEGRYDSYRGVTGRFANPQTGAFQADAVLPMLVQWGLEPRADRVRASTLRVADERVEDRMRMKGADIAALSELREAMLAEALRACPTDVRSWMQVRDLGKAGGLDADEMQAWFARITSLCGASYPEMVLEVCAPLIESVKDVPAQHAMWMDLADFLAKRADLAAQALMSDGRLWEREGDSEKAGRAYELVLKHYPDCGPPVVKALARASDLLEKQRDGKRMLALYEGAFSRMSPPKELPGIFGRQSTWYQVGKAYVALLREAGRGGDAAALDAKIERHLASTSR